MLVLPAAVDAFSDEVPAAGADPCCGRVNAMPVLDVARLVLRLAFKLALMVVFSDAAWLRVVARGTGAGACDALGAAGAGPTLVTGPLRGWYSSGLPRTVVLASRWCDDELDTSSTRRSAA